MRQPEREKTMKANYSAAALELWGLLYEAGCGLEDWSGADTVDVVSQWLTSHGIDIDAETWEASIENVKVAA
jgi:hypothetical protein